MTTATGDHQDLLHRIEAVPLDQPGASLPFSARLARDNGWSVGYAGAALALTGCLAAAGTNPAILASASASSEDGGGLTEWSGVIVIAVVVAAIVVAMGRLQRRLRRRGDGVGYGGGAGQSGWFGRDSGGGGCGSSGCGSSGCGSSGCGGGGCGS